MEIVEFPLSRETTSFGILSESLTAQDRHLVFSGSLGRIIFIKTSDGRIVVRELDYVPDLAYLQTKKFDISEVMLGTDNNDFTGRLTIKKWGGEKLSVLKMEKGKIIAKGKIRPVQQNANNLNTESGCSLEFICDEMETCTYYKEGDRWVNTGNCSAPFLANCTMITYGCDDENDIPGDDDMCDFGSSESCECQLFGTGCDDGGDGEEPDPTPVVTVDSVINEITQPCIQNAFASITADKLKNELTKLYQQTFVGNNNVHNLLIGEISFIPGNPLGIAASHVDASNPNLWVIDLNSGYEHLFTQELWGSIILHEMVHGFILKNELDFSQSIGFSSAHELMLNNWIIQLRNAMMDIYSLNSTDAMALSLEGFDDILKDEVSNQFRDDMKAWMGTKYNVDINVMSEIADKNYTKEKGTPCE